MKNFIMVMIIATFCNVSFAHHFPIKYSKDTSPETIKVLDNVFNELENLVPSSFISNLPNDITVQVSKLSNHSSIPNDVCSVINKNTPNKEKFIYGEYSPLTKTLKLNLALINEFKKGQSNSDKILCQHKNLYNQAMATIIHEFSHAYDSKVGNISSTYEFLRIAGFKKGLLKIKNKNTESLRSADPYELESVKEAFAVNMEYFILDEEYACRRPSMFNYFKTALKSDPYPNRKCELSKTVMMSTQTGYYPFNLDPKRIYRVDYLLAAPGKELSSGFGHSMFRLVVCAPDRFDPIAQKVIAATPLGKKCLDDKLYHIVVSYRANVEDATLNYFKGIFGGYPSMLFILNFGDVLDEYNRDELRDVVAYPLKLSEKEKSDLVLKVIEEHWNYRGSYKFITNNCAVESIDLLKAALNKSQIYDNNPITPNGVLNDLDQLEILDRKSGEQEVYKAKTDQLIESFKVTFNIKNKKVDKKIVSKFIDESTALDRANKFTEFTNSKILDMDAHAEVFEYKKRLIKSSSFSVIEQQILRTVGAKFRKKAMDLYFNTKDPELKKKLDGMANNVKLTFNDLANNGYGVPLSEEMISMKDINSKSESNQSGVKEIEDIFKKLMPDEFEQVNDINKNIQSMNDYSFKTRKLYRETLEKYVLEVLHNMRNNEENLQILISIKNGDKDSITKLRKILDPNLISDKEILDSKLIKLVNELFE